MYFCVLTIYFSSGVLPYGYTHTQKHTDTHYYIHTQCYCTIELRRQHITVFVFKQTHLMNDPTFVFLQSLTSFNVNSLTSPHGNVV